MTKSSDSQVTTPPTTYRITAMELATRDIKRGTDDLTAWVTEVIHLPRCDTRAAAFEAIGDALLSMNPTSAPADPDVAAWAALSVGTRKAMLSTATGEALAQRLTWACRSVVPHAGTVVSQDATWRTFQERIDVTFREMDGLFVQLNAAAERTEAKHLEILDAAQRIEAQHLEILDAANRLERDAA